MLGFMARATSSEIQVDGEEIDEARWFSRDELRAAIESGEVLPPSGISIAARLVELLVRRAAAAPARRRRPSPEARRHDVSQAAR